LDAESPCSDMFRFTTGFCAERDQQLRRWPI
jgi:hypothetical protein